MNFRKKTKEECDLAQALGDYTNGYEFLPWLYRMRPMHTLGFLGNIFIGIMSIVTSEYIDVLTIVIGTFFGVLVPSLIMFLLRREYKQLQRGETH